MSTPALRQLAAMQQQIADLQQVNADLLLRVAALEQPRGLWSEPSRARHDCRMFDLSKLYARTSIVRRGCGPTIGADDSFVALYN